MFKGQERLLNKINNLTLSNLPHTVLLVGDSGSGKHTICSMIVDKFNFEFTDITDNINSDIISEMYERVNLSLFLIDLDKISVKNENMLLKILEEPIATVYFVLITTNINGVIPTILNRCQVWELEKYTDSQLSNFVSKDYLYLIDFCRTPGQLLYIQTHKQYIKDMFNLIDLFIDHVGTANISNILSISNRIAFKDEQDKWNYDVFIRLLLYKVKQKVVENSSLMLYYLYIRTEKLIMDSLISHINHQHLFELYLFECKNIMKA